MYPIGSHRRKGNFTVSKIRSVKKARPAKRAGRALALFVLIAAAASAAFSVPSSAKLIEKLVNNTPLKPAALKVAAGTVPGVATQSQAGQRADAEEEAAGDDD